jgi:hypothetical protein
MTLKRSTGPRPTGRLRRNPAASVIPTAEVDRSRQLADIAASGDEDAAECAAADLFREFPPSP